LNVGFICDIGDKRPDNEDRVLAFSQTVGEEEWGLFAVADGMGGGGGTGGVASNIVVTHLAEWWEATVKRANADVSDSLDLKILYAHKDVLALSDSVVKMAGTTLSLMLIIGNQCIIRHVGDSRIYKINRKSGITQLTPNHTLVAEQVVAGLITAEEARIHPKRNVITRCIGMKHPLKVSSLTELINEGDWFLLCSDGFYNQMPDEAIYNAIFDTPYHAAKKVQLMRDMIGKGMATDNVSLILICPDDAEDTIIM